MIKTRKKIYKISNVKEYWKRNNRIVRNMAMDSYKEFLNSDYWKILRKYALEQPESHRCFFCRSEDRIVLHHVRYSKIHIPNLKYILPLCAECHEKIHKINFSKGLNVVDATQKIARKFKIDEKVIKQIGNKNFYRNFWSCGLKEVNYEVIKETREKIKYKRKKRKELKLHDKKI